MNKTRRDVGLGLSIFLFSVSILHLVEGRADAFDALYCSLGVISLLSSFIEHRSSYYAQVAIMLLGACVISIVSENSRYVSILIISFAYMGATAYDIMKDSQGLFNSIWYGIVSVTFMFACQFDMLETVRWVMLVTFCHFAQVKLIGSIVRRARAADILEKEKLRTTLVETVEAGMILSEEIKTRGAEHAAKG